jgi:branched-chain amino acid aminotransferase
MPIRSLDRIDVGNGGRGPVTEKIQMSFQDIVNGVVADRFGWLSYAE